MDDSSDISSSSISEDETQKLINSIRQIAPSAEIEISDANLINPQLINAQLSQQHLNRSPSPNDKPIIDQDLQIVDNQEQYEQDKKAVYSHPLFPLLGEFIRFRFNWIYE